jgi:hypothetical protein
MAKSKFSKCNCNEFVRDEDKHFLLTTHHPECRNFNPASELHGLEMQCKQFMGIIMELRSKVTELKSKINDVDELINQ